jgi:hypothetical protein
MKKLIFAFIFLANFTGLSEAQTSRKIQSSDITGALGYTPVPLNGALGTPLSGTVTNLTGTAAGITAGNVTTNANLTGDITSVGNATTLATVNANVGSFGSATNCVSFTTNAKGLITAASVVTCTPAIGSVTGFGTGIATALATNVGVPGAPVINGGALGTPASGVGSNLTALNATQLTSGTIPVARLGLSQITNSIGADVLLNNTANYFDGPSIAQGTTGTWFASGTVTLFDSVTAVMNCKLWDGTTVISSAAVVVLNTTSAMPLSLSGFITSPAANIRISCRDTTNTTGKILFNQSGNSKDSTISAFRLN